MKSCKNCAHSIHDEIWGEWKCKQIFIAGIIDSIGVARKCKFYKQRKEEKK